ncbi:MAG: hypothetical protein HKN71_12270 [Gemmatimonadetes bacterium]|nr:hypothetical protein [Gemmatimonadota bacterium]
MDRRPFPFLSGRCRTLALLTVAVLAVAVAPRGLEAQRVAGTEAGFVNARDFTGATVMGFLEARSLIFFARGAVDLGFGPEDSSVQKNGDTCEEVSSGDAVNDSRCTTLDGGVTLRAGVQFPIQDNELQLGLGYRLAKSASGVVASGSYRWMRESGWWGVTLEVGGDLIRATAGIGWEFGGRDPQVGGS